MAFSNLQLSLQDLPRFADVELQVLDPRYARVVLALALGFEAIAFIGVSVLLFVVLVPEAGMPLPFALAVYGLFLLLIAFLAWFSYKSARVIRYALREHDVIVRSGIFWRKETVQPIRRIQHVEQHQGPIDKRYGLYELKLFSAGTGHFTFSIPGLDGEAAARIKQFILEVQQDDWGEDAIDAADAADAADAVGPTDVEASPRVSTDEPVRDTGSGPPLRDGHD